jgi:hypothetical protein
MKFSIRLLYLYLFSFIGLIIAVIGTIQIVDLGMKIYVFNGADRYDLPISPTKVDTNGKEIVLTEAEKAEQQNQIDLQTKRNRQQQISTALAMLIVGLPLYKCHWNLIKKEKSL